jgi:RNA-directed DNA polymerase
VQSDGMASEQQLSLPLERPEDEPVTGKGGAPDSVHPSPLMVRVLSRDNLSRALKQVRRNKGAPGTDGMSVDELPAYLRQDWPRLRQPLMKETYRPQPVRRVSIPKPQGGSRPLGIPTVLDRFIQQAIAQVLQIEWEPDFHPHSYGFRPYRSAHQAVRYAQACFRDGKSGVVDLDLEAFFDHVNHDRLMKRLQRRVADKPLLRLINRYLKAGVRIGSTTQATREGVPQGGPLSPVLANVVRDELDWALERRGLRFARYADDCQIFVGSRRAGERVMVNLQRFIEDSLRLTVNTRKRAVDRPWKRSFLGFTFSRKGLRLKVTDKAIDKLKFTIKRLSRRTRGHSLNRIVAELRETLLGWKAYFGVGEVLSPLRDLDKWIRRRLRSYVWKQWGRSGYRELRKRGVTRELAWNTAKSAHGPWRLSRSPALAFALPARYFRNHGLPELAAR